MEISISCIFILLAIIAIIASNMSVISKKRTIDNYDPREVGIDYVASVTLPGIGARTTQEFAGGRWKEEEY